MMVNSCIYFGIIIIFMYLNVAHHHNHVARTSIIWLDDFQGAKLCTHRQPKSKRMEKN